MVTPLPTNVFAKSSSVTPVDKSWVTRATSEEEGKFCFSAPARSTVSSFAVADVTCSTMTANIDNKGVRTYEQSSSWGMLLP